MTTRRPRPPLFLLALAGWAALYLAAAFVPAPASFAQDRVPPAPDRWVTDQAGFLAPETVARLDARLEDYERRTGHQLLVWIGRTFGRGTTPEEFAVKAFEAWRVGRKGIDDGLVLFIFAEDRKVRIEVGYGLEDRVPDIYAYRVIDGILVPGIREGRGDEAVEAAVTALIGHISGDGKAAGGEEGAGRGGGSTGKSVLGGLLILVLLIIFITNPSFALWLLISILSGGRGGGGGGRGGWGGGGGGWSGGGGFSGGGGRSGGGGASGGW
ncbi:MAG TPA: TPM domain-containing protein [Candidatus Aminicenantes bacterium]|nr:TPM domain-containing protein [Candidatus Aminicenantes bacterium]